MHRARGRWPSPAIVLSVIAVFGALGGAAYALPGKSSVDSGDIKNNSVKGPDVKDGALKGNDVDESSLAAVPNATNATNATNADKLDGHDGVCPGGTTLIRGLCFDSASSVFGGDEDVFEASDDCRASGGFLPSPLQLRSTRDVLDLGAGDPDAQYTDTLYDDDGVLSTLTVDDSGTFAEIALTSDREHICAYPLVR